MKKFNIFLITIIIITICIVAYLSFRNSNYICSKDSRVITRNEWKAKPPIDTTGSHYYNEDLKIVLKHIILHHSGFSGDFGVKNIQKYQQDNGFNDIAYHFLIGKDGKIFEGRDINLLGAHAGETLEANSLADSIRKHLVTKNIFEAYKLDPDYGSIGICLDGNFEEEKPTDCQIQSLKKLVTNLMQKYNIDESNIMLHNEVNQRLIFQKNLQPIKDETVCPGKFGVTIIKDALTSI